MSITYSRYKNNPYVLNRSSKKYSILRERIVFEESDSDQYYTVEEHLKNRLDLISYKYYNTAELWWVIAEANDINDPFAIEIGTYLRIPGLSKVQTKITE